MSTGANQIIARPEPSSLVGHRPTAPNGVAPVEASTDAERDAVEWCGRIREGDLEAEGLLVERYSRGVRFLLLHLSGDPALADDLHQETFQLVLEKVRAGTLREPRALPGFIRQIARNLHAGFVRQRRGRAEDAGAAADDALLSATDESPDPLQRVLAREDASAVRDMLDQLERPRDRDLLVRYFVAEHSKEAICRDFGLTSLHFNRVLHRARQRLKQLLAAREA